MSGVLYYHLQHVVGGTRDLPSLFCRARSPTQKIQSQVHNRLLYFHLRMEGVCRARPHDDEPSVVRSRLTVYHELYPAGFYTRDWGFFVKTIWLVVDFGVEGRSECVKLLTVVNLNPNSRRQDAPTAGHVGFCTGPNPHGPIQRANAPTVGYSRLG